MTVRAPLGGRRRSPAEVEEQIRDLRLVAILRLDAGGLSSSQAVERAIRVCETLDASGVHAAEITIDRRYALESIEGVAARLGERVLLGAGTVLDTDAVDAVADAGARFCVSPHLDADVVAAWRRRDLLPLPGVLTPTEVVAARALDVGTVKLFPAEPLGPAYLAALRAPFASIGFMPTGGVHHANAARWLSAGAVALGVGSWLVPADGSLDGLAERARDLVQTVRSHPTASGAGAPAGPGPITDRR
jgi:2-dehydro-3-deoxyphosphogluconate aldolase/(4S)-4-hydroxy-2-oxoglutarate aldolase